MFIQCDLVCCSSTSIHRLTIRYFLSVRFDINKCHLFAMTLSGRFSFSQYIIIASRYYSVSKLSYIWLLVVITALISYKWLLFREKSLSFIKKKYRRGWFTMKISNKFIPFSYLALCHYVNIFFPAGFFYYYYYPVGLFMIILCFVLEN